MVFLLLITFLTVTPHYFIPIISYPFFFTFSFSVFLISILLLLKYNGAKKYRYLLFSAILFFISLLFYETYLIFGFFIGCFIIIKSFVENKKNMFHKTSFYKEVLPFISVAAIYVIVYFAYRYNIQTNEGFYEGSSFAKDFSIANFFKILWNYNKAAFPTFVYHASQDVISQNSLLEAGHQHNFWYILRNSPIIVIVNAILQCIVFFFLCKEMKPNISWKKIGFGILVVALISISAHILLACSEKYNTTSWHKHNGYVTTFYSYFCVTLIIGLTIYACIKACYRNNYLKYSILSLFTIILFCVSIIIGYSNDHLSRDWQKSQNRFVLVDQLVKENIFDAIDSNAIIFDAELSKTISCSGYWICDGGFRWKDYIFIKTGKKFNLTPDVNTIKEQMELNPQQEIYYIAKYETAKNTDVLVALSKIDDNSSIDFENEENPFWKATSKTARVYYYSAYKNFMFGFVLPEADLQTAIYVNDEQYSIGKKGMNIIEIYNKQKKRKATSFTLQSDESFWVEDFLISNIGYINLEK